MIEFYRQLCWDLDIVVKTGSRAAILKEFKTTVREIATTKKQKKGDYYFTIFYKDIKDTTAILSQLRLIDAKRLKYKIGIVGSSDFGIIRNRIISFLK